MRSGGVISVDAIDYKDSSKVGGSADGEPVASIQGDDTQRRGDDLPACGIGDR